MTVKKSLKRRVRARMGKTGERYAAARRQVITKADRTNGVPISEPAEEAVPAPTPALTGPGVSDEAVRRKTGRGWDEWLALIDAWGGTSRTHPEIANWLMSEHDVDGWWAQSVTVGYERARGMRAMGQLVDGFSATASKTVNVPVEQLYTAVADGRRRARWLPGAPFTISSATPHRSVRGAWEDEATAVSSNAADAVGAPATNPAAKRAAKPATKRVPKGSRISIELSSKGDGKSLLQVQHTRLRDAAASESFKSFWRERLAELKRLLES